MNVLQSRSISEGFVQDVFSEIAQRVKQLREIKCWGPKELAGRAKDFSYGLEFNRRCSQGVT